MAMTGLAFPYREMHHRGATCICRVCSRGIHMSNPLDYAMNCGHVLFVILRVIRDVSALLDKSTTMNVS